MRKTILSLLLLFVATTMNAQGVLKGDMNGDGKLSITDVTALVNAVLGEVEEYIDVFAVDNSNVVGTWYAPDGTSLTFNDDNTTDYTNGGRYEYRPFLSQLTIYDTDNNVVKTMKLKKVAPEYMLEESEVNGALTYYINSAYLVTEITLSQTTLSLKQSGSKILTATVAPSTAFNTTVTWSSSDGNIATVDQTGKVKGIAVGSCTITATATDGSGVTGTCAVTIADNEYVDLGLPSGTLWATCNVGANSPEEYGEYFAWGETEPKSEYTASNYTLYSSSTLAPSVDAAYVNWGSTWCTPSDAQLQELINSNYTTTAWTSLNGINGRKITSKSNGNSIFLPAAGDRSGIELYGAGSSGYYWSCERDGSDVHSMYFSSNGCGFEDEDAGFYGQSVRPVRVTVKVTSITLSPSSLTLSVGSNQTLTATILPSDASNKGITWSSSNTSVATVDQTGKVTAVMAGSCTITATAKDGSGKKGTCAVTINGIEVTSITLSPSSLTLSVGSNQTLTATILPSDASNKGLTWSSSNTSVATVDQTGKVTAVMAGSCTITATAKDGSGKKGTCAVTINTSHEYVDLGLTSGTLWATCNIGATTPTEFGDYFAWGETVPYGQEDTSNSMNYTTTGSYLKTIFAWNTYKYCNGQYNNLTKYCTSSNYGRRDTRKALELSDDAAYVNWGSEWRMPTKIQVNELISECTWTKKYLNNKLGFEVKGSNGNTIFLPFAGWRNTSLDSAYEGGGFWTCTLDDTGRPDWAYHLSYFNNSYLLAQSGRDIGFTIRPVRASNN